jgi:Kdo2-lipid IVA lauroyltransferase/acyltransferase
MFYLALSALKLLALLLFVMPRAVFMALGKTIGAIARFSGFRLPIVRGNIDLAFPEWSQEQREALLKQSYQELGVLFLELLRLFFKFDRFVERNCFVEGKEHLQAALKAGRGVLVLTSHLGNWEVLAASGPVLVGTPVTMVTKRLKPAWLNRVFEITRSLLGVRMAFEPKTMPEILRALKKNEAVGFVMDQYAGAPVGARVPFFGKAVGSHTALATLALRTGAPVVPAFAARQPGGRYLIRFEPALCLVERGDPDATVVGNTALFVRHIEAWIRLYPAQWLWIHRRWKGDLSPLPSEKEGELLA